MVRNTLTFVLAGALAEVSQVAFLADSLQQLTGGGGGQGLPGAKHPNAMLLLDRSRPANRVQSDMLPGILHSQGGAGFQLPLFPRRLGDNDVASFVYDETGGHFGMVIRVGPSVNPISSPK